VCLNCSRRFDRHEGSRAMSLRRALAQQAYAAAIRERHAAGKQPHEAVCVFDCVEDRGVEVRFKDIPSLEGMYYSDEDRPLILISSCRPRGRRAFNCAHEFGHHVFGHGTKIDELGSHQTRAEGDREEFLADCFAGSFLMPKSAVDRAFAARKWDPTSCTPEQAFAVAGWLGVGYETLLTHMLYSLRLLSQRQFDVLTMTTPKDIKGSILGKRHTNELILVDCHWEHKAVDISVGDMIALPSGCRIDGACVESAGTCSAGTVVRGLQRGMGRAYCPRSGWAVHIRVSKQNFEGLSRYRHFPEPDDA
jgi:Zn-dependent peptidase ImmA (M78 family)